MSSNLWNLEASTAVAPFPFRRHHMTSSSLRLVRSQNDHAPFVVTARPRKLCIRSAAGHRVERRERAPSPSALALRCVIAVLASAPASDALAGVSGVIKLGRRAWETASTRCGMLCAPATSAPAPVALAAEQQPQKARSIGLRASITSRRRGPIVDSIDPSPAALNSISNANLDIAAKYLTALMGAMQQRVRARPARTIARRGRRT
jgi:hypothetical protein